MKTLFVARSLDRGGAERYLTSLAVGLRERGHDVTIAVFYGGGSFEEEARSGGVDLVDLRKRGRWDLLGFGARLFGLMRRCRPEFVYGILTIPSMLSLPARWLVGAKVIWGVQNTGYDAVATDWLDRLTGRLEVMAARRASVVIANSESGRKDLVRRGLPPQRIAVIPNGVDTDVFRPDPIARARIRAELGLGTTERIVGIVGRIDPVKDHATFLDAAALVRSERRDVRFVVVGDGPQRLVADLRGRAESLGIGNLTSWLGPRDDIPAVMNSLDVLVSSSVSEGMPNVLVEAMACGVPCVATDVGDSAAVIDVTGATCSTRDPAALAMRVSEVLGRVEADDAGSRGAARARVLAEYTTDLLVARTESLLEGIR